MIDAPAFVERSAEALRESANVIVGAAADELVAA